MEIIISDVGESSRANHPDLLREFNKEELHIIEEQLKIYEGEGLKLQEEAERGSTSCIYRVLPRLKKINGNSLYEPNMVSIGPYYYKQRKKKFMMAEDFKRKCFGSLLVKHGGRAKRIDTYRSCLLRINELEEKIRNCYSEQLEVESSIVFLEMMVVDACFIIEIIEMFGSGREVDFGKSLAALTSMVPYFYEDFLQHENQIPFFVLEEIYALIHKIPVAQSRFPVTRAALSFFMNGMKRSDLDISSFIKRNFLLNELPSNGTSVLHLLDLVRSFLMPFHIQQGTEFPSRSPFIHCISKLRLAGIKVSPGKERSFLEVKFKSGVIEMPSIAIDDLMRCVLLNCVAFEQCHQISSKYFTAYATLLDCLVNTAEDVEYLRERNVVDNYLTNDSKLVDFINNAGKDLLLKSDSGFYLQELFEDVDRHYRDSWEWKWASFKREYFDKPWLLLSAAGGLLLVLATSFQAVMAFLTYKYRAS